jgi:hypothetical protein
MKKLQHSFLSTATNPLEREVEEQQTFLQNQQNEAQNQQNEAQNQQNETSVNQIAEDKPAKTEEKNEKNDTVASAEPKKKTTVTHKYTSEEIQHMANEHTKYKNNAGCWESEKSSLFYQTFKNDIKKFISKTLNVHIKLLASISSEINKPKYDSVMNIMESRYKIEFAMQCILHEKRLLINRSESYINGCISRHNSTN